MTQEEGGARSGLEEAFGDVLVSASVPFDPALQRWGLRRGGAPAGPGLRAYEDLAEQIVGVCGLEGRWAS